MCHWFLNLVAKGEISTIWPPSLLKPVHLPKSILNHQTSKQLVFCRSPHFPNWIIKGRFDETIKFNFVCQRSREGVVSSEFSLNHHGQYWRWKFTPHMVRTCSISKPSLVPMWFIQKFSPIAFLTVQFLPCGILKSCCSVLGENTIDPWWRPKLCVLSILHFDHCKPQKYCSQSHCKGYPNQSTLMIHPPIPSKSIVT
jgi:hypothetical protein